MIAKAKAISHGINAIRYITGESRHKKHPEKIYRVSDNLLSSHSDAMGIWNSMQLTISQHRPIKNSVIRIEVSPPAKHTWFYNIADWQELWQDFAAEFDKQKITDKKGKVLSCRTNLANSKSTVWLHTESKGGVPHLHAVVCRIDEDGNINNDHQIHLRAQRAAERVARERGWTIAVDVNYTNINQVSRDCLNVIRELPAWSWDNYKDALMRKGYTIHERVDSQDILRGYAVQKGNSKYKASELGVGRNLMVSKLPFTWKKLHHRPKVSLSQNPRVIQPSSAQNMPRSIFDYIGYRPDTVSYTLNRDGQEQRFYIPEKVIDFFNDEFDYRSVANHKELTDMAVALFIGLLETPSMSVGGGGGSQSELPWRDKDDDDLQWARRCARAAERSLEKKQKTGLRR